MPDKKKILTYSGLKAMEEELQHLKVVKRKEIAEKIKEARAQGDLSENAEYDAAKDEQGEIEARIAELDKILKNAEVIDEDEVDLSNISVGCKVLLYDLEFEEEIDYAIVGSTEADPLRGKLSNESPVGAKLMGASQGDIVEVSTPAGMVRFKVLEIHR
jgi:transcription elongation factor GreA